MLDRFKDAKWYIRADLGRHDRIDPLSTIIYDASDLEGTGPDGHGMVCQDAVIEDARLIVLAPTLLRIVKTLLAGYGGIIPFEVRFEAREAIAKVEGE